MQQLQVLAVNNIANDLHVDQENLVDAVVLDSTKAFDRVPHRLFIHKLCFYGMSEQIEDWVQVSLTSHSQRGVIIDGSVSQSAPVRLVLSATDRGKGKSKLQVPDTGMSQYWSILEYFWCTSIARNVILTFFRTC